MERRELGHTGIPVSVLALGCNKFGSALDLSAARSVVHAALDSGITLFDTADVYGNRGGSESILGRVLANREDLVLATKFGHDMGDATQPRGARSYVRRAVDASLRRLRTDYIDLYQYHRPDGVTPLEETFAALEELVQEGKVRAIGASHLSAPDLERVAPPAGEHTFPLASVQGRYSLLAREAERDVLPMCERLGVGFLPFFPLAGGLLTGKYRGGQIAPVGAPGPGEPVGRGVVGHIGALTEFAKERRASLLEVAIGALLARPAVVSVLAGATTPDQVRHNAAACGWRPTATDTAALAEALNVQRPPTGTAAVVRS